jgi:hypothetical protein
MLSFVMGENQSCLVFNTYDEKNRYTSLIDSLITFYRCTGQKAAEGLFPACIEVSAKVSNPSGKDLKDVSVYGFVKENDAGNSVLPNNPDFKSDAGQYAMIKRVEDGESQITFQFVAATTANVLKGEKIPELTFFKTKAVSYPGGDKFQALDECEIDPRGM